MKYVQGSIFNSNAIMLVNPVNRVGVMGAGLAKVFKEQYPKNYEYHRKMCLTGRIKETAVTTYKEKGKIIFNLPTKFNWQDKQSDLILVQLGLVKLREYILANYIASVAIPALGCGLGGLPWNIVRNTIEYELDRVKNVDIEVYEPWK